MTMSIRSITFSMRAVGFALGTALILPAALGTPTGPLAGRNVPQFHLAGVVGELRNSLPVVMAHRLGDPSPAAENTIA